MRSRSWRIFDRSARLKAAMCVINSFRRPLFLAPKASIPHASGLLAGEQNATCAGKKTKSLQFYSPNQKKLSQRASQYTKIASAIICLSGLLPQGAAYAHGVWVIQSVDCGRWLTEREAGTSVLIEGAEIGLIDGLALGTGADIWASGIKPEQVFFFTDNHCRERPLDHMISAVFALFKHQFGDDWIDRVHTRDHLGQN